MSRIAKLVVMPAHPVLGKLFNKLNQKELDELTDFVCENKDLSDDAYVTKVNRWYLDAPEKPKHLTDMWAIALQVK